MLKKDYPFFRIGGKSPLGVGKRVEALQFFHVFKTILIVSYDTEGMKCWYFICFSIYLTTIDDNFISIPLINLAIFSIQWSKSGWKFQRINVPTDQVPCKTIGISNLHCALHTHMLTIAKSVLSFEIGVILW